MLFIQIGLLFKVETKIFTLNNNPILITIVKKVSNKANGDKKKAGKHRPRWLCNFPVTLDMYNTGVRIKSKKEMERKRWKS